MIQLTKKQVYKKEYKKEYYQKNKERIKEYNKNPKVKAHKHKYYLKNKERYYNSNKKYRQWLKKTGIKKKIRNKIYEDLFKLLKEEEEIKQKGVLPFNTE